MKYTGLMDMLNGGGAGAGGSSFEGGPISGLLNAMDVKPMGYADRTRPQARPAGLGPQMAQQAPQQQPQQAQPMQYGPQSRPNNAPMPQMQMGPQSRPNNAPQMPRPGTPQAPVQGPGGQQMAGGAMPLDLTDQQMEILQYLHSIRSEQGR